MGIGFRRGQILQSGRLMRHRRSALVGSHPRRALAVSCRAAYQAADDKDQVLFNFEGESAAKDWAPVKLPEIEKEQPAPTIEIVATPKAKADDGQAGKCLKITFAGGDWPTVAHDEDSGPGQLEVLSDAQGGDDGGSAERCVLSHLPGQA